MALPTEPEQAERKVEPVEAGGLKIDWAAMALEWMREDASGGSNLVTATVPAATAEPTGALGLGRNPGRCNFGGGPSPEGIVEDPMWFYPQPGTAAAKELAGAMFLSSPVVTRDAIYGATCLLDPPGAYGTIFCLDAATGEQRWLISTFKDAKGKQKDFKGFFSSPALTADGKSLVIGQGLHMDADSDLVCIDTQSGTVRWIQPTSLHIEGSPAIEGDIVVAGAGAIEDMSTHKPRKGTNPGFVFAVQISTGKKLWEHQVNDPESSPLIIDGVAYIGSGFNGNAVVALRTESDEELAAKGLKRELWRTQTPFPATGAITAAGDLLLVGCGNGDFVFVAPQPEGAVIALDRKTGEIRWQQKMGDAVLAPIAAADGKAICPVRTGELVALDISGPSPKVLWTSSLKMGDEPMAPVMAGVAFTGKRIYAVSNNGYLGVLNAADGKLIERIYINSKTKPGEMSLTVSSPTVLDGRIFVGSETGGFRCYRAKGSK
jgi:outer membrane protein assembly factor BamB